jgi:hypothetical protein
MNHSTSSDAAVRKQGQLSLTAALLWIAGWAWIAMNITRFLP